MSEQQAQAGEDTTLIVPDFSEVQDRVGVGEYSVRVTGSKPGRWEKDGKVTPYIAWELQTFGEPEEKNNGRKVFHNTPITGKGAFRLKDFFKAAMGEECPATGFDRTMLHGRELKITVGPQKDNPEYTEIKLVKPLAASVQ